MKKRGDLFGLSRKEIIRILIFLLVVNNLVLFAYTYTASLTGKAIFEYANITRVIDGDTFEYELGKARLLGVNTPEKNQLYYDEAKDFLSEFEGKQIKIEKKDKDKYERDLVYVYFNDELINKEILEKGLGSLYYYEKDNHFNEMKRAEENARNEEIGVWKKSSNFGCVKLIELKYEENERCNNEEQLILFNKCEKIQAVLKDDATHIFNINLNGMFVQNFSCNWNNDGDSLYLWDKDGLILFYRY